MLNMSNYIEDYIMQNNVEKTKKPKVNFFKPFKK
jgi:hypothetical protein